MRAGGARHSARSATRHQEVVNVMDCGFISAR